MKILSRVNELRITVYMVRDCRQITFVMLNGLCPLSKTPITPPPPPSLTVLNGQYYDGLNTKQNQMKNTPTFCTVFQVLKVPLIKTCKISHQIFF